MIKAAIRALMERNGSSKRAIAKYIESVYVPETELNMAIRTGSVYVPVGSVNGDASSAGDGKKKGIGRPPKQGGANQGGLKKGRGRLPKSLGAQPGGVERSRERPKRDSSSAVVTGMTAPVSVGMPTGATLAVGSGGVAPAARKSPGPPPKAGGEAKKPLKLPSVKPKKPRKLSGKPLGRPKKSLWLWRHPYANQGFGLFHRFM